METSRSPAVVLPFLEQVDHVALLLDSHLRFTGRPLLPRVSRAADAVALYEAPFAVLSHGADADPCFTWGNRVAEALFEVTSAELLAMRSRLSAEPVNQAERQRLLDAVSASGYIDDYAGVRISRTGRRFRIEAATVWTLVDEQGRRRGQAATFARWTPL